MSTLQLRSNFHKLIDQVDDENILEEFYNALRSIFEQKPTTDFWDELTFEQQQKIEVACKESEEGKLISHLQVMEKYSQWLSK